MPGTVPEHTALCNLLDCVSVDVTPCFFSCRTLGHDGRALRLYRVQRVSLWTEVHPEGREAVLHQVLRSTVLQQLRSLPEAHWLHQQGRILTDSHSPSMFADKLKESGFFHEPNTDLIAASMTEALPQTEF